MEQSCAFLSGSPTQGLCMDESKQPYLRRRQLLDAIIPELLDGGLRKFYAVLIPGPGLWAAERLSALRPQYPDLELILVEPLRDCYELWPDALCARIAPLLAGFPRVVPPNLMPIDRFRLAEQWMIDQTDTYIDHEFLHDYPSA